MKHVGGLLLAAFASFVGGIAVVIAQYYLIPTNDERVRQQIALNEHFEVRIDKEAIGELAGWYLPGDEIQEAIRDDDEISFYAYRMENLSDDDLVNLRIQIVAEDYKGDFSVLHAAITDPYSVLSLNPLFGQERWHHYPLEPVGSKASATIELLKPNEAVTFLLATNYSSRPEVDFRSEGVDIIAINDEDLSLDDEDGEWDLTWLIVLAFSMGGLLLGLGLSEKLHRSALNSIGFDYDELSKLVRVEAEKRNGGD